MKTQSAHRAQHQGAVLQAQLRPEGVPSRPVKAKALRLNGVFHHPDPLFGDLRSKQPAGGLLRTGAVITCQICRKGPLQLLVAAEERHPLFRVRLVYEGGVGVQDHPGNPGLPGQFLQQKAGPKAGVEVKHVVALRQNSFDRPLKEGSVLSRRGGQEPHRIGKIPVLRGGLQARVLRQKVKPELLPVHVFVVAEDVGVDSPKPRGDQMKHFHLSHTASTASSSAKNRL